MGFDKQGTIEGLRRIPERHRVAFAAVCAERLLPLYEQFNAAEGFGDPRILSHALASVWEAVEGKSTVGLANELAAVEGITPDTDDFEGSLASRALDAATAVAQAIDTCLDPTAENAAVAAEIAWEAAFGLEQSRLLPDGHLRLASTQAIRDALRGDLPEAETRLQRDSLRFLADTDLTEKDVEAIRERFGSVSA